MSESSPKPGFEEGIRRVLGRRRPGRLADLDPRHAQLDSAVRVPAAVLLLMERSPGYGIVLTKRSQLVEHHKGEISLPGGMRDAEDTDDVATALREVHEELGVQPEDVEVLGVLDDLVTVTNFEVTPVVGVIPAGYAFRLQENEVERVLHVPLAHLRDDSNWFTDVRTWRGKRYELRSCRFRQDVIWGATSRMLQNFLAILESESLEPSD